MRISRPLSPLRRSIDYPPGQWKILLMEEILLTAWDVQNLVNGIYNLPMDQPQVVIAGFLQQYLSFGRQKNIIIFKLVASVDSRGICVRSQADGITPVDRWKWGHLPPKFGFVDFSFSGAMIQQVAVRHRSFPGARWYAHRVHRTGISTYIRGHYITNPKKANPSKLPYICIVWSTQNR